MAPPQRGPGGLGDGSPLQKRMHFEFEYSSLSLNVRFSTKSLSNSYFGGLGSGLGGPRSAFGGHFGDLGVPLGAFGAQSAPKSPSPDPCRSISSDFSVQMEPKRLPKLS